jgi:thiol-disulfide isomerase/thioredoxin
MGREMRRRIIITLGLIYVTIVYGLAAFRTPLEVNRASTIEGQACEMVDESQRGNGHSGRLPGSTGLPETSGRINGKFAQCQPSATSIREDTAIKVAAAEVKYPPNYLLIWTAKWCQYCPQMKAVGDKFKEEGFDVFYIDFDENQEEAKKNSVALLPTAVVYTDSEEVKRVVGINPKVSKKVEAQIRGVLEKNGKKTTDYAVY